LAAGVTQRQCRQILLPLHAGAPGSLQLSPVSKIPFPQIGVVVSAALEEEVAEGIAEDVAEELEEARV